MAQVGVSARSAGLAGCGIATSSGADGFFYNPASLAAITGPKMSASANAYGFSSLSYEDYYSIEVVNQGADEPGGEAQKLQSSALLIFPSSAATAYPLQLFGQQHAVAVGTFVPSFRDNYAELVFSPDVFPTARRTEISDSFQQLHVVAAYGIKLSNFAAGLSVAGVLSTFGRSSTAIEALPGFTPSTPLFYSFHQSLTGWSSDLQLTAGALAHFGAFHVGLSAKLPGLHLAGAADYTNEFNLAAGDGNSLQNSYIQNIELKSLATPEVGLGLSYELGERSLITSDFSYLVGVSQQYTVGESFVDRTNALYAINSPDRIKAALGFEFALNPTWVARLGVAGNWQVSDSLPDEQDIAFANAFLEGYRQIDIRDSAAMKAIKVIEELREESSDDLILSFGLSREKERSILDISIVGILSSGQHLSRQDHLFEDGSLGFGYALQDLHGYTVLVSIGGTLEFTKDEDNVKGIHFP